ncbi:hypothetical protein Ae201684P_009467 [Aphanomyces euteiches]|uniref:Uncharacterized protein n=1 Tax=Aphanomyces euteiches TaxID=100861 RepID=A0A6G0WKW3_9STRA|nr:hypothetical protein Ae201684_014142 [Aphanomyces euteiches]KAH9096232.1 hypothetical protein Ae201684P_009467 [Aphanomyces euteiches]
MPRCFARLSLHDLPTFLRLTANATCASPPLPTTTIAPTGWNISSSTATNWLALGVAGLENESWPQLVRSATARDRLHFQSPQTFIQLAEQTVREVAKCSDLENGPINWKQRRMSDDNLVVYEGLDAAADRVSCAKSELQATIEEVQMMTFAESSEDYKLQAQMFNTGVIDAARLYNLVLPTDKAPLEFVGIN